MRNKTDCYAWQNTTQACDMGQKNCFCCKIYYKQIPNKDNVFDYLNLINNIENKKMSRLSLIIAFLSITISSLLTFFTLLYKSKEQYISLKQIIIDFFTLNF